LGGDEGAHKVDSARLMIGEPNDPKVFQTIALSNERNFFPRKLRIKVAKGNYSPGKASLIDVE